MVKKTWDFVCDHGSGLMLGGFGVLAVSTLVLFGNRRILAFPNHYVWYIGGVGLLLYIIGRIGVIFRKRRPRQEELSGDDDTQS
jgi:hypothetical protein